MDKKRKQYLDDFLRDDDFYSKYLDGQKKKKYRTEISKTTIFAVYYKDRAVKDFFGALSSEAPFKYIYNLAVYLNKLIFRKRG